LFEIEDCVPGATNKNEDAAFVLSDARLDLSVATYILIT
jgi:hypothetical protein